MAGLICVECHTEATYDYHDKVFRHNNAAKSFLCSKYGYAIEVRVKTKVDEVEEKLDGAY